MSRVAYVNGRYLVHAQAGVSIEDRGYQFADGVYEVVEVHAGALVDEAPHLDRLAHSLREIDLAPPMAVEPLRLVIREVVQRNRVRDGMVYLQITRGVAGRDHVFPNPAVPASLVVTARGIDRAALDAKAARGVRVVTMQDLRWKRPDIKSISLLPNVLAKQAAKVRGAAEAWLLDEDGWIREGAASNAWIVDQEGKVITHPVDRSILRGITRTSLVRLISDHGLAFVERPFSLDEAYRAKEAFITGATTLVTPVVMIDDTPIGDGRPGPIVAGLRRGFHGVAARVPVWTQRQRGISPLAG